MCLSARLDFNNATLLTFSLGLTSLDFTLVAVVEPYGIACVSCAFSLRVLSEEVCVVAPEKAVPAPSSRRLKEAALRVVVAHCAADAVQTEGETGGWGELGATGSPSFAAGQVPLPPAMRWGGARTHHTGIDHTLHMPVLSLAVREPSQGSNISNPEDSAGRLIGMTTEETTSGGTSNDFPD